MKKTADMVRPVFCGAVPGLSGVLPVVCAAGDRWAGMRGECRTGTPATENRLCDWNLSAI